MDRRGRRPDVRVEALERLEREIESRSQASGIEYSRPNALEHRPKPKATTFGLIPLSREELQVILERGRARFASGELTIPEIDEVPEDYPVKHDPKGARWP